MKFKTNLNYGVFLAVLLLGAGYLVLNALQILWASSISVSLIMLFGAEVLYALQGKKFMLKYLTTYRDKLVFFVSLSLFWIIASMPRVVKSERFDDLLFLLLGLLVSAGIFAMFLSRDVKKEFLRDLHI